VLSHYNTTTTTTTSISGQGSPLCPHLNNYTLKTQITLNKTSASDTGQTGSGSSLPTQVQVQMLYIEACKSLRTLGWIASILDRPLLCSYIA